ncbi:hypothetical protein VHEMI01202 [[Torrubiella] hemipterigena]|uniref:Peptidase M43 pregnancy-associated plasma-A domain-containing protein n=1 Tax=[Torrubiella] hemipterigena TaxID=1531966 RepID=A0A0A1T4M8_9HYPO|nr:hypothetical protein VHEMI01202 [[Torrubiella] hemipterigena]
MLLNKLLVVFAATAAALIPIEGGKPCGTELTDEDRQMSAWLSILPPVTSQENIVIDTYMHIIAESNSTEGGYVPKEEMEIQFKNLVKDYEKTGFTFALKDITWTVNEEWSNLNERSFTPQVKALRKGSYKTLNLFYVKFIKGAGGFCGYPKRNPSQNEILHNVCFNRLFILPNGRPGSLGKTTTHEVGH